MFAQRLGRKRQGFAGILGFQVRAGAQTLVMNRRHEPSGLTFVDRHGPVYGGVTAIVFGRQPPQIAVLFFHDPLFHASSRIRQNSLMG